MPFKGPKWPMRLNKELNYHSTTYHFHWSLYSDILIVFPCILSFSSWIISITLMWTKSLWYLTGAISNLHEQLRWYEDECKREYKHIMMWGHHRDRGDIIKFCWTYYKELSNASQLSWLFICYQDLGFLYEESGK